MVVKPVVAETLAFHWFVRAARGAPWPDGARCASTCSLAMRLALVSRANRGNSSLDLAGEYGVSGAGVPVRDGNESWWILLRRPDNLGGPRPIGSFMNLCSESREVGKSSKPSSSNPSPKCLRLTGLVICRFAAASRAKASAPLGFRFGLGDLMVDLDTAREDGRRSVLIDDDSES
jgi:hypothetical protein